MEQIKNWLGSHRAAVFSCLVVSGILVLAVGAAFAYDHSQKERIAPGITIGGVDVGGLSREQAREKIDRVIVSSLSQPLVVRFEDTRYEISAKRLKRTADVEAMLDSATERSREGDIVSRILRYVRGRDVSEEIPTEITYSTEAVTNFVRSLAETVDRQPENATLVPAGDRLRPTPGVDGIEVRKRFTKERIDRAIVESGTVAAVEPVVKRTKPEISRKDLADAYPTYITIDRSTYTLRLFKDLKLSKRYTVAVGQVGLETPAGFYSIQDKQVNPAWHVPNSSWAGDLAGTTVPPGPGNPIQARWMGIYNGAGIHGTNDIYSLGSAASHGCVRMSIPDVIDLYDRVSVGTPVYIL
jgi:lipoprotein-anchoring transpeptidase ErfK/SrfK